jgi:aspartyl-tRNA(Asn)/glutamyl-tRNA(Gln) amidotransferase subunit A
MSTGGPVERLEGVLARLPALAALNLFSHIAADEARSAAAQSAQRRAGHGPVRALEGLLVAVKGNIAVRGWPFEGGLSVRAGMIAEDDAPIIARLRAAGAVLLGQTSMDEGALSADGVSPDGPIGLPMEPARSTGGSSGGSAGALAAGLCDLALGTDTIGSLRIPAALCGVAALKPSYGRVSTRGVLPVHPRFDHAGPMARRIADLPALLEVIGRYDPLHPLAVDHGDVDHGDDPLAGRRIGFAIGFDELSPAREVIDGYNAALETLRRLGADLLPVDLRPLDLRRTRRAVFALCEHEMWRTHQAGLAGAPERFSPRLRAMLDYGASLPPKRLLELEARVVEMQFAWEARVADLYACVTPTVPVPAFEHAGGPPDTLADLTVIGTAAAVPAASVPCAVAAGALPVGLQVLTPRGRDRRALRVAAQFEAARATTQSVSGTPPRPTRSSPRP